MKGPPLPAFNYGWDTLSFVDLFRVSHDGKSMTIIRSGSNPEGQPYKATLVFDRQ
jgi:hypothetical protein